MFEKRHLKQWAGSGAYGRGEEYFRRGLVVALSVTASSAEATVNGTYPYRVLLRWRGETLHSDCDCPVGERGDFCKHCVAVALAWLKGMGQEPGRAKEGDSDSGHLLKWLNDQPREKLVALIADMAARHRDLHKELMLRAAAGSVDLKQLRQAVRKAIGKRHFIEYHQMPAYVRRLSDISTMLEQMLAEGHAKEVQQLSLYAIERLSDAMLEMDDSDGMAGSELDYWLDLHRQAWLAAPPQGKDEQQELARDLFARQLAANWDEFTDAAERYAEALGDEGIAEFRRLIEAEWDKLPKLSPGNRDRKFDGHRWRITGMMESLAKASGDLDALIRIKMRDLSTAYDFLRIAELCREAGRDDEALEWAEKGMAAFTADPDTRLEEFLISEFQRRGESDKAVTRAWGMFERDPSMQAWFRLKELASHIGKWDEWRSWALDLVRDRTAREKRKRSGGFYAYARPGASLLVEIFLSENDPQQAMQEAERGGCRDALWEKLALAFGEDEPMRAVDCLKRLVEPMIGLTNNDAYEKAVAWIETIGIWMCKAGEQEAFADWVVDLGKRYKAKRNFIKLMRLHALLE